MHKKISTIREVKLGDLVYHILYGKEWVAILLKIEEVLHSGSESTNHREMALVQMQPGTKYENFFEKRKDKRTPSMGFVSANWLFKLEES